MLSQSSSALWPPPPDRDGLPQPGEPRPGRRPAIPGDQPAAAVGHPGKIEVLEFFAYTCPHCAAMEPLVEDWAKTAPPDVVLKQVPIAFNAGMKPLQQHFTLIALERPTCTPRSSPPSMASTSA